MGKEKLIPIFALIVLIIGSISSIYVYATQIDSELVNVNSQDYTIDQIFFMTEKRSFEELEYSGVALDDLIIKSGVANPEQHEYTIVGADGYQKTVTWANMKDGLLTIEKQSIFSELPKAFRVKDIVKIEVE